MDQGSTGSPLPILCFLLLPVTSARYIQHLLPLHRNRQAAALLFPLDNSEGKSFAEQNCSSEGDEIAPESYALTPAAIDMLVCHLLGHHADGLVRWLNSWPTTYVVDMINSAAGDKLVVDGLTFNVTGPRNELDDRYFRCDSFRLSRAKRKQAEVLLADVGLSYENRLSLQLDVSRLGAPAVRMINPLQFPMRFVVWGHAEGVARLRLTIQADDSFVLRLAHVAVTDVSTVRIRLEDIDYSVNGFGFAGAVRSLVPDQLPLRKLEAVANDALQQAFLPGPPYKGWDVMGGVQQPQPPGTRRDRAVNN